MIALKETPVPTETVQGRPPEAQLSPRNWNAFRPDTALPPDIESEPAGRIKNILVPTDFSRHSAEAVARAAALARSHDATLTILHVIDINPSATFTHCGTAENLMRQLWVTGASELSRLRKSLEEDHIKVQTLIVEGLPAEAIVENSSGFNLLVMGEERSKSGWNFFSRHTTRRVVQGAACPVTVVHQNRGFVSRELESKANTAV